MTIDIRNIIENHRIKDEELEKLHKQNNLLDIKLYEISNLVSGEDGSIYQKISMIIQEILNREVK